MNCLNEIRADLVCDCHNDSIMRIGDGEYDSLISPYNLSQKHSFLQIFAIFNENGSGRNRGRFAENLKVSEDDTFGAVTKLADIYHEGEKYGEFRRCTSFRDVKQAALKGENCGFLGLEGAGMVDTIEKLHILYDKQVRFITLTWNGSNCIASGCSVSGTPEDRGLNPYGKEFLKECGKLGISVDLSHASVRTMYDVLEFAEGPVLATHSNFRSVCDHVRNLPDEVAEEIVRRKGFIGLNTYLPFVRSGVEFGDYDAEMLFDHIDYALEKGFGGNVGFGFDIDGVEAYAKEITFDRSIHDQYLDLMEKSGRYSDEVIYDFRCMNFIRFLKNADRCESGN